MKTRNGDFIDLKHVCPEQERRKKRKGKENQKKKKLGLMFNNADDVTKTSWLTL